MNLQEAIEFVLEKLQKVDKRKILKDLEEGATVHEIAIRGHHGFGTFLRNELRLWDDDISGLLKAEIWCSIPEEERQHLRDYWTKSGHASYAGEKMHADDASGALIEMAIERLRDSQRKPETNLSVHLSHCNFGEHVGSCKYGDANCPALTDEWAWFGNIVQENQKLRDKIQVLEERLQRAGGPRSDRYDMSEENAIYRRHEFGSDGFCIYCDKWQHDDSVQGICFER